MQDLNKNKTPLHEQPIFIRDEKDGEAVEIALQWNEGYTENIYCFTNTIKNLDGGTHLVGFKAVLTRTMNKYIEASGVLQKLKLSLEGDDIRAELRPVPGLSGVSDAMAMTEFTAAMAEIEAR